MDFDGKELLYKGNTDLRIFLKDGEEKDGIEVYRIVDIIDDKRVMYTTCDYFVTGEESKTVSNVDIEQIEKVIKKNEGDNYDPDDELIYY